MPIDNLKYDEQFTIHIKDANFIDMALKTTSQFWFNKTNYCLKKKKKNPPANIEI